MTLTLVANINRKSLWPASACKTAHLANTTELGQGKQTQRVRERGREGGGESQTPERPKCRHENTPVQWQHLVWDQRCSHACCVTFVVEERVVNRGIKYYIYSGFGGECLRGHDLFCLCTIKATFSSKSTNYQRKILNTLISSSG